MSKILANELANYGDNAPIDLKEGLNIPSGKPLQAAGSPGASGQVLTSTGTSVSWGNVFNGDYNNLTNRPSIPAAQVNSDWNATSGVARILNKPVIPAPPSVTIAAPAGSGSLSYSTGNGEFTFTPPDLSGYLTTSYNETSTLDDVIARNSITSRSLQTGSITAPEITLKNDGTNNGTLRIYDTGTYTRLQFRSYTGVDAAFIDAPDYNLYLFSGNTNNSFVAIGDGNELKCYRNPSKIEFNANVYANQNMFFGDGDSLYFGASNDLRIYHSGGDSYIQDVGQGALYIESNGGQMFHRFNGSYAMVAIQNAQVDLFWGGNLRLSTTYGGAQTAGVHNATGGYSVNGSNLDLTHLASVDLSIAPTNGQVLKYDGSTFTWKPAEDLTGGAGGVTLTDLSVSTTVAGSAALAYNNSTGEFTFTPPDLSGYLTAETDPVFSASAAATIQSSNISNWDSAFGWGNHATAGYLTSYTETDTLQTVTARGATTNQTLTVNNSAGNRVFDLDSSTGRLRVGSTSISVAAGITMYHGSTGSTATLTMNAQGGTIDCGSLTTDTIQLNSGNLTTTGKLYYSNAFALLTDLQAVSASTYHGMFAHAHDTGHGYVAHAGGWIQLLDTGSSLGELADVDLTTNAPASGQVLKYNGTNWVPDVDGGVAGGGPASVTVSDIAPGSPTAGDLWWESDTGRLKLYYQDVDSSQWVDASPPLAPPNVPVAAGNINMNANSPTWTGTTGYTVAKSGGDGSALGGDVFYTLTFPAAYSARTDYIVQASCDGTDWVSANGAQIGIERNTANVVFCVRRWNEDPLNLGDIMITITNL